LARQLATTQGELELARGELQEAFEREAALRTELVCESSTNARARCHASELQVSTND
jgi:hypothetical protein